MTLLLMEGFDLGDNLLAYAGGSAGNDAGRWGGRCLITSTTDTVMALDSAATEIWVGFDMKPMTNGQARLHLMSDSNTVTQIRVDFDANRTWSVYRNTTLIASLANVVPDILWHHVRVHAIIHDTTGLVEVFVDGAASPVITFSGDTRNAGATGAIDTLHFDSTSGGTGNGRFDNLWVTDTGGSAPYNDDMGELVITTLLPNGNGNYSQLVGSDGNSTDNYLLVDESTNYAVADYNGSATVNDKDTYLMSDLPSGALTVYAVQDIGVAFKSDAGAKSGRTLLRASGTDYAGTTVALATTPSASSVRGTRRIVDPATGVAWANAAVDALEAGFEVLA